MTHHHDLPRRQHHHPHLTRDDPQKAERCFQILKEAERGEIELVTSESVLAEVVYLLASPRLYHLPPDRIRSLLLPIVNLRGLKLRSRRLFRRALAIYASQSLDFEDALTIAHMERAGINRVLSYDRHFDGIEGIERCEP